MSESNFICNATLTCPCISFGGVHPVPDTCDPVSCTDSPVQWLMCAHCCAHSWPSSGHQPGEEQAVPGCSGRLPRGSESAGPAGRLPRGQRQQPQHAGASGSTGEGWAAPAPADGTAAKSCQKAFLWSLYMHRICSLFGSMIRIFIQKSIQRVFHSERFGSDKKSLLAVWSLI